MSKHRPPLEYRDVIHGVRAMGFEPRPAKPTSHEQWVKIVAGRIYKVTVDRSKAPFGHFLIKSMARQAGVSVQEFYRMCGKEV